MRRVLFTLGGTQLCLHPATPLFMLYMALAGHGRLLLIALLSILLHEGGHALAAACFGHPPQELELTPLGCLIRLEDERTLRPWQRLIVLLAGPGVTALLAMLSVRLTGAGILPKPLGEQIFRCNAALLMMNLTPALPLDGGRLLALLLGVLLKPERVRQVMRALGTLLGAALIAANVAVCVRLGGWNLSLACAGCFLIYAAGVGTLTAAMEQLQWLMDRKLRLERRGTLYTAGVAVLASLPLRRMISLLHPARYTQLTLLEPGSLRLLGTVSETQLIAAYLDEPAADGRRLLRRLAEGREEK